VGENHPGVEGLGVGAGGCPDDLVGRAGKEEKALGQKVGEHRSESGLAELSRKRVRSRSTA